MIASVAGAQVAVNRNTRSIFVSDVTDARGIWVNPGSLGLADALSVYADITFGFDGPYDTGSPVQQWSAGFNSHFLALAYQADRLPDALGTGTIRGNALRVAIWGRHKKVGGGGTATWHTGDDGGVAFDAGVLYRATPVLDLGAVLGNVGQPTVRGIELRSVLVPAVTLHTAGGAVALQTQAEIQTDGLQGFAVGTAIHVGFVHVTARLDTDGDFRRESFTFGLAIGGQTRVGTLVSGSGDLSELEATSVHLTSEKSNQPRRRSR